MIKILRGDDSSAVQITPTIPDGLDLTGAKLVFECGGLVVDFADFQDGVSFTFPRAWTSRQPVGRQLGRWSLVWSDGRKVTTTNTFPVYLTDVVSDVGGESRAEIHVPEGAPLEGLTLDPNASSASLLTILAAAFRRLGGTVAAPVIAVLIGFATLSAGAVQVSVKQPGEFRPNVDPVVTAVDLSGLTTADDLASATNGLARASDVAAARAVADAAASTNATQGAALSQLSQRTNYWDAAAQNATDALAYSRATYDFQRGNTNAWFSGTNYVFGADATNKTTFAFEPGMDLATMPCSLALMELRDGTTQNVWDQRDWTVWYWNFKNAQQEASISARFAAAAEFNATNYAPIAWGRRTSSGLANPDQKTLWVDAEKTVLAPGMAWESTVEVSGCAYWTIVGSATLSGTTNGVITIKDFEGKPVFSIKKTSSRLAYLECGSEIYTSGADAQGRATFTMRASVQPKGMFSTVLDDELFVDETDEGCPVDYEWETVSAGVYRCHFLLKPGILSDACFAKFKVEIQGETAVEFSAPQKITGGIIYNDGVLGDVKIRPVITSTAVGSVVTWEVAP